MVEDFRDIETFLEEHPALLELLRHPQQREALASLCLEDFDRLSYLLKNPWLNLERVVTIADNIMNISPEVSGDELLNILCKYAAQLTSAQAATCRTYDPLKNSMVASGSYNWSAKRRIEIPYEDSLAGRVIKEKNHLCVPDISAEPQYQEAEKATNLGLNSILVIPIVLFDYEGTEKKDVLLGALQIYFREKSKIFYPQQIKLVKSIVSRFSYVIAQQRKQALQKKSEIIRESRKALISILKRTQSLDQVLSFLVTKIAETIDVHRCSLFSVETAPDGNHFSILIAGYPLDSFAHKYGVTLTFDEHPAFREVYESGQALLIEDARSDPRMKASYELYLHEKIENVYFFPLKDEDDVVANVLVLDGDESRPLDKDDLFFCDALIQDIELCIQASIRSQERHDFFNQMLSFGAIARVYAKKLASPNATGEELNILYKKLYKSMLGVNDIITDRVPFAQKEDFDLNEVIAERLEAFYLPPQVVLEQNIEGTQIQIQADKKKVGRIVGNLLDNAHRKLEELKKGVLKVHSYIDGDFAVIEIGNTGFIPEELQKTILQSHRLMLPDKREDGGQGLSIVKLFTVMHNGTVTFDSSRESNWTVFRVRLPLNSPEN